MWDRLMAQHKEEISKKGNKPIKITLTDGKVIEGLSWKTTPYEVAEKISKGLAENAVIAKVNDEVRRIHLSLLLIFIFSALGS